ncbi:hypothetical protein M2103_001782 [Ereboglobus sp. PH5-5]|uniref:TonB-dependent receptor n=1 Tax=Ereboglobus sp. PH5-5 TaxID=2940529 RepID=UPI002404CB94|nr:TonB-dependent receptor [Ereboglobus sp. PH5-5]MDF9833555.1 hypothetical protein [Ereboglobus sp. PH5-5]
MNTVKYYKFQLRLHPSRHNIKATFGLLTALALSGMNANLPAQQTDAAKANTDKEVISVTVEAKADQPGKFTIDRERVELTPSTTGTIEETLRPHSNIQFDLTSRSSSLGGEITPPRFSIRGGTYYANAFLVDGVSNNNVFGQGGFLDTNTAPNSAPSGEAQSIFLNPDLIGAIVVHTDNVPIEYGNFTGGVFDAKIRDPKTDSFHASLSFQGYTRDSWTSQKYREGTDPDLTTNTNTHQPRFEKYSFAATAESPLFKNIAGLLSYSENRSTVPVWDTLTPSAEHTDRSVNRNLLVKLSTYGLNGFRASLTTTYAPYEREWRVASRKNSFVTSEGGGISTVLNLEKKLSFATLSSDISYRKNSISRDTATNQWITWANSSTNAYANWAGTSSSASEGNWGDYDQDAKTFDLNASLQFVEFGPKYFRNHIKIGGEWKSSEMDRTTEGSAMYLWNKSNDPANAANGLDVNAVGDKENGVITGEQWLNTRWIYEPTSKSLRQNDISFYVEDTVKIERLTVRPAIRFDHETYLDTSAWSPRIFVNVDVLNNGILNIFGGAGRYAGSPMSSVKYSLLNMQETIRQKRSSYDADWETYQIADASDPYGLKDLKWSHSNSFNLGASTVWNDIVFRLTGNITQHRDQIRTMPGLADGYTRMYINSGESDYKGITLEIERKLFELGWAGRHSMLLSFTWSKTESNSRVAYAMEELEGEGTNFTPYYVFHNGKLEPADNLPATNFNSPLVVTFSDLASFWGGRVRLYNILRFEKGGDGLVQSNKDPNMSAGDPNYNKYYALNDGRDASLGGEYVSSIPTGQGRLVRYYTTRKYSSTCFWDMTLDIDIIKTKAGTITLQLQVTNVLNRHSLANTSLTSTGGTYSAGRQLYTGVQYKF